MPNRYIEIPKPIRLTDPRTKEEVSGDDGHWDFEKLLHKISDNPKWNASYKLGRAMDAVWEAWEKMPKLVDHEVLVLAEEDWKELEDAVQNPKQLLITANGPQIITGFGLQPRLIRQLLPFCAAIIEASTVNPTERVAAAG